MSQPRTVLITGSSSGFGLALTRHFLSHGWNTIATSRNPSRTPELVAEVEAKHSIVGRGRGKWLQLDVCESQEVIDGVIAEAERVFADGKGEGGGGLDVVINNAGYSILGPLETVNEGRGRGMMDANVSLLPLEHSALWVRRLLCLVHGLRACKHSSGARSKSAKPSSRACEHATAAAGS